MTFQEAYERISAMPDDSACKRFIQRRLYVMAESAGEMQLDGDYVETVEELLRKQRLWVRRGEGALCDDHVYQEESPKGAFRHGEVVYVMPSHIKDVTPKSPWRSVGIFLAVWASVTIALVYWGRL